MKNIFLVLAMSLFISCISDRKTGIPYRSESIEESKKRNAFISDYSFEYGKNSESEELQIREVWTEREWEYKDMKGNLSYTGKNNFVVKFKDMSDNADLNRLMLIISKIQDSLEIPFGGGGKINDGVFYDITNYKKELDSFRLYFIYKEDAIPIYFRKKN